VTCTRRLNNGVYLTEYAAWKLYVDHLGICLKTACVIKEDEQDRFDADYAREFGELLADVFSVNQYLGRC
jgi:hypothetical protein